MQNTQNKIWNATLYLRLSRDDGDKEESNSITGQRELLRDYISQRPEFREYAVRVDDGFSGSTFERPSFQAMIEDVKAGRTDCIIVKDLSRFGRNYLDAGEYIEKIFRSSAFDSSPSTTTTIASETRKPPMTSSFHSRILSTRLIAAIFQSRFALSLKSSARMGSSLAPSLLSVI